MNRSSTVANVAAYSSFLTLPFFRKLIVDSDLLTWEFTRSDLSIIFDETSQPLSHYYQWQSDESGNNGQNGESDSSHLRDLEDILNDSSSSNNSSSSSSSSSSNSSSSSSKSTTAVTKEGRNGSRQSSKNTTPTHRQKKQQQQQQIRRLKGSSKAHSRSMPALPTKGSRLNSASSSSTRTPKSRRPRSSMSRPPQHQFVLDFGDFFSKAIPLIAAKTFPGDYRVDPNKACAAVIHRLGAIPIDSDSTGSNDAVDSIAEADTVNTSGVSRSSTGSSSLAGVDELATTTTKDVIDEAVQQVSVSNQAGKSTGEWLFCVNQGNAID